MSFSALNIRNYHVRKKNVHTRARKMKFKSIIKIHCKKSEIIISTHTHWPQWQDAWMDGRISPRSQLPKKYKWIKCVMEDWKVDHKNIYWVACIIYARIVIFSLSLTACWWNLSLSWGEKDMNAVSLLLSALCADCCGASSVGCTRMRKQ